MALSAERAVRRLLDRLDRSLCELDTLLSAKQIQQNKHAFVRTQSTEQTNMILQRALQNPHARTRFEPQLRQLNQPSAFARTDFSDDLIGDPRWDGTIHHEATHTRGPEGVAGE